MKKQKYQTFTVMAKIDADLMLEISAENLAEAVEKAKNLKWSDFIEVQGEANDVSIELTGIFK